MDNETFITQDGNSDGHFKSFSLTISISFQSAEKSSLFLTMKRKW